MNVVNGKLLSERLLHELKKEISKSNIEKSPTFAIIQIGKNLESNLYIKNKKRLADELGFTLRHYKFDSDATTRKLLILIKNLNENDDICGIMLQLPIPKKIDKEKILNAISPKKDIDGLNKKNQKKIKSGNSLFISPTALSVEEILNYYKVDIKYKNVLVIGNGIVAGKPISNLLRSKKANVKTLTKKHEKKIANFTYDSDIIISAVGQENLLTQDIIPKGKVLIDVGTKVNDNNKLVGDLDFKNLKDDAFLISPTPGGVGVLTVIFLMKNIFKAYKINTKL